MSVNQRITSFFYLVHMATLLGDTLITLLISAFAGMALNYLWLVELLSKNFVLFYILLNHLKLFH